MAAIEVTLADSVAVADEVEPWRAEPSVAQYTRTHIADPAY